jgi:hypothetical protein
MKKFTKLVAAVLASAMVLSVPASAVTSTVNVNANKITEGIRRSKNGYNAFYMVNNRRVRNSWKKVRENGKDHWMYFESNGYNARAKKINGWDNNVAVKNIGGKRYGFDVYGYRVSGDWVSANKLKEYKWEITDADGQYLETTSGEMIAIRINNAVKFKAYYTAIFSFKKNGEYDVTRTRKLRGLAHAYMDPAPLLKALGTPVKKTNAVYHAIGEGDVWKQKMYMYDHLVVITNQLKYTKKTVEVIVCVLPYPENGTFANNYVPAKY